MLDSDDSPTRTIRVRVTDSTLLVFEKTFEITVIPDVVTYGLIVVAAATMDRLATIRDFIGDTVQAHCFQ